VLYKKAEDLPKVLPKRRLDKARTSSHCSLLTVEESSQSVCLAFFAMQSKIPNIAIIMSAQKELTIGSARAFTRPSLIEIAELGCQLSSQSWVDLNKPTETIQSVEYLSKRILALLIIRILGILSVRGLTPTLPSFPDLSTSSICHAILKESNCHKVHDDTKEELNDMQNEDKGNCEGKQVCDLDWPEIVTEEVLYQLHEYVCKILEGYHSVSYHNREHAYHVFTSASKLLDMVLCEYDYTYTVCTIPIRRPARVTYGLKSDPLTQLAFLFSALVHDVDHTGVSNRQLVLECDELALMYNDQSVAEQRSLAISFSLLMKKDFETLRKVLFKEDKEYMKFRKIVIDLVLCTDIASPERVQIVKSKWKEAFGDKRPSQANRRMSTNIIEKESIKIEDACSPSSTMHTASRRSNVFGPTYTNEVAHRDSVQEKSLSASTSDVKPILAATEKSLHLSQQKRRNEWKTQPVDSKYSEPGKLRLVRQFFREKNSFREKNTFKLAARRGFSVGNSSETSESVVTEKKKLKSFRRGLKNITSRQKRIQIKDPCNDIDVKEIRLGLDMNVDNSSVARGQNSKQSIRPLCPVSLAKGSSTIKVASNKVANGKVPLKEHNAKNMDQIKGILNEYEDDLSVTSEISDATSFNSPSQIARRRYSSRSQNINDNKLATGSAFLRAEQCISGSMLSTNEFKPSSRRDSNDSSKSSRDNLLESTPCRPRLIRRFTEPPNTCMDKKKFHFRLGIRRALDLTGNQIDEYKPDSGRKLELEYDPDLPDEFKVIVILEQLMKASDVAANMQGWDTMVAWCERLFQEQKKCHDDGRGEDPITDWHENQIGFFESYTMPLACRLAETGVLGFGEVQMLVNGVRQNNLRWMIEGKDVLIKMVKEWKRMQYGKKRDYATAA
jgi:hypothetical protein